MSEDNFCETALTNDSQERIDQLRGEARALREQINQLIQEQWLIEKELNSHDVPTLHQRKKDIAQQISDQGYNAQLDTLLKTIKQLEIELHGISDIGSNSPYVL